jgi:hypothetical protein
MDTAIMYEGAVELLDQLEMVEAMAQHVIAAYAGATTLDDIWEPILALELALTELEDIKRGGQRG